MKSSATERAESAHWYELLGTLTAEIHTVIKCSGQQTAQQSSQQKHTDKKQTSRMLPMQPFVRTFHTFHMCTQTLLLQ
jgi:hypothetical protein